MARTVSGAGDDMRPARMRWLAVAVPIAFSLAGCGGSSGGGSPTPPPAGGGTTVVSGKATFDLVPHNGASGLDYLATRSEPIRGAVVQLLRTGGAALAQTVSDAQGDFSFSAATGESVFIRVRAEMVRTGVPSWNFTVVDNTSGAALYVLDGAGFTTQGATQTRNVDAPSGWTGSAYTQTRAAAPFAILDAIYKAYRKVLSANSQTQFPTLITNWSVDNRAQVGNLANGEITTSFYRRDAQNNSEIYLLGAANQDTDEYDDHVVIHEWGHYFEDRFARSDSVGGAHGNGDRLDLRVAFSEGFGYAWAGMVTDDPNSRDSGGFNQAAGFNIDVERNVNLNPGWYSEGSVQSILYDLYDAAADGSDTLTLGLQPIYDVVTGAMTDDVAMTSIFSFLSGLKAQRPDVSAQIDAIVAPQAIVAVGVDSYGSGETNNAGRPNDVLPVYTVLPTDGTVVVVCSLGGNADFGSHNKLSNRRFLRFNLNNAGRYRLVVSGPTGSDPDAIVFQRNVLFVADSVGDEGVDRDFLAGDYVVEVYEFQNLSETPLGRTCLNVSLTPI